MIKVLFFGILKDITGLQEDRVEVASGTTLEGLFKNYSSRFETLEAARPSILFARNQEFVSPETILGENDEVAFLPPVSGGSKGGESKGDGPNDAPVEGEAADRHYIVRRQNNGHIFGLTRSAICSNDLTKDVQRPEDGAVIVFEGVVRNNTKGRKTRFLEYECYEAMAIQQMEQIGLEIAAAHAIGRIAMVHRLGRLEIGEASVSIVVSAPHRQAAFQAALDGINRLKREVPIWKKEFFEDGAIWVEGEWDEKLRGQTAML